MRKTLKTQENRGRIGGRSLAAATLAVSLAAFGCSTTDNNSTVSGQPAKSAPAAGSMGTNPASTPGSSSGTAGIPPQGMVSSATSDTDAIATLKADEAYRGRVLGPAAPGTNNTQPSATLQQPTGEATWPSLTANPISTVNSSISSPATPVIVSGAGGDGAALAVVAPSGGITATSVSGAINSGAPVGVANTGVTGVSNVSAAPIISGSTVVANTTSGIVQGNGLVTSATPAAGNAIATPTLGTSPRLSVDNGIGVTGGVGNASVVSGINGGNATANGVVLNGSATSASATSNASNAVTAGMTSGATTNGATGNVVLGTTNSTRSIPSTTTTRALTAGSTMTSGARGNAIISRSTSTGAAVAPIAVVTDANGSVTVTNVKPESPSMLRRAARALGFKGRTRAVRTATPSNMATPQPVNSSNGSTQQQ